MNPNIKFKILVISNSGGIRIEIEILYNFNSSVQMDSRHFRFVYKFFITVNGRDLENRLWLNNLSIYQIFLACSLKLILHLSPPTPVNPLSFPFKQPHCVSTTPLLLISIFFFFTSLLPQLSPHCLSPSNKRIVFQLPCFFQFPSSSSSPFSSYTYRPTISPLQTNASCFNYHASSNFHLCHYHFLQTMLCYQFYMHVVFETGSATDHANTIHSPFLLHNSLVIELSPLHSPTLQTKNFRFRKSVLISCNSSHGPVDPRLWHKVIDQ